MLTNGPGFNPRSSHTKDLKKKKKEEKKKRKEKEKEKVLDTSLLNTQHYKVRIKSKAEQSRERSSALPYTAIEKGAFELASTTIINFTYTI